MSVVRSHVTRSIRFVLASTCESCEIIARRDDIGMMTHHGAVQGYGHRPVFVGRSHVTGSRVRLDTYLGMMNVAG